jgi:hypothetical protein
MTVCRLGLAVALFALGSPALARAQSCPHLPAGARCAPLPDEGPARREALRALDAEGRAQVRAGDLAAAARAFGCLVEADPTPESAGNLTVVLREQGSLGDALLVARCAEQLSVAGPARERARDRREEIERRLGLPPSASTSSAPVLIAAPNLTASATAEPSRPRARRGWSYAALAVGAATLIGSGVTYAFARARANQFADEERVSGYTDRARRLHDEAGTLELSSFIGFGVGAAAALTGVVLLRF